MKVNKLILLFLAMSNVALKSNDISDAIESRDPKQLEAIIKKYGKVERGKPSPLDSIVSPKYLMTPLEITVTMNLLKMTRMLLDANVDINKRTEQRSTVLEIAVRWGYEDMVELLLSRNADTRIGYPAHMAVTNLRIMKTLLSKDRILFSIVDNRGDLPIHAAARYGSLDVLKELIRLDKPSINTLNHNDMTPFQLYTTGRNGGNPKYLECFVQNGANINQRFSDDNTPLINSIVMHNSETALKAIDLGADVNLTYSITLERPLHYAVKECLDPEIFKVFKRLILDHRIDINLRNINGATADEIRAESHHMQHIIANKLIQWRREVNKYFKHDPKKPPSLALSALLKAIRTRDRSEVINAVPAEYTNMVLAYYDCYGNSNLWATLV